MREILFRGKDVKGNWHIGLLAHIGNAWYISNKAGLSKWNGKVIGEFICDCIIPISITYSDPNNRIAQKEFPYTCLTDKEIMDYLGNSNQGYGWHISNLAIYDEPKELDNFKKYNRKCWYADLGLAKRDCPECQNKECFLTHPPQSWCYVEV